MAPFRNKGWVYFNMISEIIPNASARGSYAFSPMNTTLPGPATDDLEAVSQAVAESATASSSNDFADVDGVTLISTVASKFHKIPSTTMTVDNDDTLTFNSGFPPPPSADSISNPISESDPTTDPRASTMTTNLSSSTNSTPSLVRLAKGSRKTRSTPAESRSGLLPSLPHTAGPSRRTKAAVTSRRSSGNAEAASSSILVHNMQGSINMLTATVRDSVAVDPITKVRQEAIRLVQKEQGLSYKEQIALFQMFTDKHALAQTYLAIEAAPLRLGWLRELLKDVEVDD